MKKLILLFFTCSFFFSYASYAQNKVLDAGSAYGKCDYDKFAFIDALAKSNDPQSFIPYFSKYIDNVHVSRIILMEDMAETVYPKYPQIATIFALYLCDYGYAKLDDIVPILNHLPRTQQYFKTMSAKQKKSAELDSVLNGGNQEKNVVVLPQDIRAIVFSDGRIVLLHSFFDNDGEPGLFPEDPNAFIYKGKSCKSDKMFLYNPNGISCYGRFKDAETGKLDVTYDNFEEHKNVELYTGVMFDNEGKRIGYKWGDYPSKEQFTLASKSYNDSIEQAEEDAKEAAEAAKRKKEIDAEIARLTPIYGAKVARAAANGYFYKGMPWSYFKNEFMLFGREKRLFDQEKRIYFTRIYVEVNNRKYKLDFVNDKLFGWEDLGAVYFGR